MTQILAPRPVKKRTASNDRELGRRTNATTVTNTTKMALIINMCPADLAQHLRINSHVYKGYEAMKTAIREYVDSDPNNEKHEDDEEGDLNRLDKGKGKAKGEGRSSGTGFKEQCWNCGYHLGSSTRRCDRVRDHVKECCTEGL